MYFNVKFSVPSSVSSILRLVMYVCLDNVTDMSAFLRFCGDIGPDLPMVLRQSTPKIPILMLHTTEAQTAQKLFNEFAVKKQTKIQIVPLSGHGAAAEKVVKKHLMKGMAEVCVRLLSRLANYCTH